ncbi:MAG: PepSY domain-containing protein [Acholeplasmataceae bacterium]
MKKFLIILFALALVGCQQSGIIEQVNTPLSIQEAKRVALSHGFIKESDAKFLVEELVDFDPAYYLFVINYHDKNHLYKIETRSGKILVSSDSETEESISKELAAIVEQKNEHQHENTNENNNSHQNETQQKTETPPASKNINKEKALEIALKDSALKRSSITKLEIKEKVSNKVKVFEVEFYYNQYEYEYYISISDGKIIKKEIEYEGKLHNNNEISMAQAKQLALSRVKGANNNHIKIKEDYEDGRLVYEGKIRFSGYEYEFEIDAKSGIFLEWEMEVLR